MTGEDALNLCAAMAAAEAEPERKKALDGFAEVLRRVISREITARITVPVCVKCGGPALVASKT